MSIAIGLKARLELSRHDDLSLQAPG